VKKLAVLVTALALLGAACSSDDGDDGATGTTKPSTTETGSSTTSTTEAPAPEAEAFSGSETDFYEAPDPLPDGEHGDLVRYQEVGADDVGTTYRIMYLSESVAGKPIAVTGTAIVPKVEAPADGRRLFTIAHGTTGIADECAPSKKASGGELALAAPLAKQGYLMAETDYEGLGTPGRHPYLVGMSEGRGTIDAILAAKQLPDADGGDQLAIAGYSQGGHGSLWANEVAEDWAPDLDVVGTFAGAPATEIDLILSAAPRSPVVGGFAYMIIAGFEAAYGDEADPSQMLTPKGVDQLSKVDEGCVGEVIAAYAGQQGLVKQAPVPADWLQLAKENNPGQVKTDDPILILHSAADNVVPLALSGILFNRMCGEGQVVERRVLEDGLGHGQAAPGAYGQALTWLEDRFEGKPATSTCPAGGGTSTTTTTAAAASG